MKLQFMLEVDTENGKFSVVNTSTGEVQDVKIEKKKATTSRKKKEESTTPQLILEENKYTLNSAAVELMGVEPEDRLSIKYKKVNKSSVPVIGTDEAFGTKGGNKLTKTFTVACRGKANEELSTYGSVFTLSENPDGSGTFLLAGDKAPATATPVVEDEAVDIEDKDVLDDLQAIGDSVDDVTDAEEVNADDLDNLIENLD